MIYLFFVISRKTTYRRKMTCDPQVGHTTCERPRETVFIKSYSLYLHTMFWPKIISLQQLSNSSSSLTSFRRNIIPSASTPSPQRQRCLSRHGYAEIYYNINTILRIYCIIMAVYASYNLTYFYRLYFSRSKRPMYFFCI